MQDAASCGAGSGRRVLQWGSMRIGAGRPALAVAITGPSIPAAVAQAECARSWGAEVLELRLDLLQEVCAGLAHPGLRGSAPDLSSFAQTAEAAVQALVGLGRSGLPILLTCRTKTECGQAPLGDADYAAFLQAILERSARLPMALRPSGLDVEIQRGCLPQIAAGAHALNIDVVGSFHDFAATPACSELESLALRMVDAGADLAKIAVMPQKPADVARLLHLGARLSEKLAVPVATISMGEMGAVSRVAPVFGSALTFTVIPPGDGAPQASAPGQLPIDEVRRCLDLLAGGRAHHRGHCTYG